MNKLRSIGQYAEQLGYDKKRIHIVWIVNDVEVAKKQNQSRSRVVPIDILVGTHVGAANTMKEILSMGKSISKYMDGEIVLAFNKVGADSDFKKSGFGGLYIKDAKYVYLKKSGKGMISPTELESSIYDKIKSYVPDQSDW